MENAKNLGRSDDAKQRKKRGWPKGTLICRLHANVGNKTGRGEAKKGKNNRVSHYVWAKNVVLLTGQSLVEELDVR